VGLSEIGGQRVELRLPKSAVRLDPARDVLHWARDEPAAANAALLRMRHQAGALEHAQMLVDAGEGHAKRTRQLRERRFARGQPGEDRAARGVGERGERGVECGCVILNHMVNYRGVAHRVKWPGLPPGPGRRLLPG